MKAVPWDTVLALEVRRAVRTLRPELYDITLRRRLSRARIELRKLTAELTVLQQQFAALRSPAPPKRKRNRRGQFVAGVCAPSHHGRGPNRGSFRPGQRPANLRPLGSERLDRSGVLIKIAEPDPYTGNPHRWVRKARHVWECTHGRKVPPGCLILQMDSDPFNCEPDNLVCIDRSTLPVLAKLGFHRLPLDERPTELARVQLLVLSRRRAREELVGGHTLHRRRNL